MLSDEHYKKRVIGAINSYIRLINSSLQNGVDNIISSNWTSHLRDNGKTFVAIINVKGKEEKLFFAEEEWKSIDSDLFQNSKLINLLKRLT